MVDAAPSKGPDKRWKKRIKINGGVIQIELPNKKTGFQRGNCHPHKKRREKQTWWGKPRPRANSKRWSERDKVNDRVVPGQRRIKCKGSIGHGFKVGSRVTVLIRVEQKKEKLRTEMLRE